MSFLTKEDFNTTIRQNVLDEVIAYDDEKIETACEEAVSIMAGYLSARYDTQVIFAATGINRHKSIVMYCKDIVLYNLHSNISPRKIPKLRYDRYASAIDWLEKVSESMINPTGLPTPSDGSKEHMKFGGNPRRDNNP